MNAIERFKKGGCYVCPQSLHEFALFMDWAIRNIAGITHLNSFGDVGDIQAFMGFDCTGAPILGNAIWKHYKYYGEDITEKFFKELENDNTD